MKNIVADKEYRKVILDSSALIAYILQEEGWQEIQSLIPKSVMSSANVIEVATNFIFKKHIDIETVKSNINKLIDEVIPLSEEQAYIAAGLIIATSKYGLSLGDRACVALGEMTGYPIYTTDKIWDKLQLPNVTIKLIR